MNVKGSLSDRRQEDSVPQLWLTLVSIILEGPSIKDQPLSCKSSTPFLAVTQLLLYNSAKHVRKDAPATLVRHSISQKLHWQYALV